MRIVKVLGVVLLCLALLLAIVLILARRGNNGGNIIFISRIQNTEPTALTQLTINSKDLSDAYSRYAALSDEDAAPVKLGMPRFTGERVQLVFTGKTNYEAMRKLVSILEERGLSASFFLSESDIARSDNMVSLLLSHHMTVGLNYEDQAGSMDTADADGLISRLMELSIRLRVQENLIHVPVLSAREPRMTSRKAAAACGFSEIIVAGSEILLSDCSSVALAGQLLLGVERGDIVRVELTGTADESDSLSVLLEALAETNTRKKAQERLAYWTSDWGLAYPLRRIDTTEEGAIFTFSGLSNVKELDNVLTTLRELNGRGLFYVTLQEAVHDKETIRRILSAGHELGIYVPDIDSPSAEEYLTEIISVDEEIRLQYGYNLSLPVYVPYDQEFNLLKACSAGGFSCATAYLLPIRPQDTRRMDGEEEIMADILSRFDRTVHRGELVHFDLGQFLYSDTMASQLVRVFAEERCAYPLKSYHAMLSNGPELYTYPLDESTIFYMLKNRIRRGQLSGDVMNEMQTRYIGSPWMDNPETMIGFTDAELRIIDKTGILPGHENEIFLTINDCELDVFITPILHVLKKHGAKATFFLRTETADWNPNLTRAIAKEGHALALRADATFDPLLEPLPPYAGEEELRQREVLTRIFQTDCKTAYDVLLKLAGDLTLPNGNPAVTRLFRAPLEVASKEGLTAAFDSGFPWIVGQVYKTQDTLLDAEIGEKVVINDEMMLENLIKNTKGGAILSISYAYDDEFDLPKILDEYLARIEQGKTKYRFVSLNEALN